MVMNQPCEEKAKTKFLTFFYYNLECVVENSSHQSHTDRQAIAEIMQTVSHHDHPCHVFYASGRRHVGMVTAVVVVMMMMTIQVMRTFYRFIRCINKNDKCHSQRLSPLPTLLGLI